MGGSVEEHALHKEEEEDTRVILGGGYMCHMRSMRCTRKSPIHTNTRKTHTQEEEASFHTAGGGRRKVVNDEGVSRERERDSERVTDRERGRDRERESDRERERDQGSVYPESEAGEEAMWRRREEEEEDALEASVVLALSHDTAALQLLSLAGADIVGTELFEDSVFLAPLLPLVPVLPGN